MTELLSAILGALLGYLANQDQARRERRRQRAAIATALMYELRGTVSRLARLCHMEFARDTGFQSDYARTPVLDRVLEDVPVFEPQTIVALFRFAESMALLRSSLDAPVPAMGDLFRGASVSKYAAAAREDADAVFEGLKHEGGLRVHDRPPADALRLPLHRQPLLENEERPPRK